MRLPLSVLWFASLALLALGGCRREEIRTYTVKKEAAATPIAGTPTAAGADAVMRNTAVTTAEGPGLAWAAPDHWKTGPEKAMRKATYLVPGDNGAQGAELAVTAFPGDVGGPLANVNRWRGQLSLPALAESELATALTHLDVGGLHIDYVELAAAGTPPTRRVLGALVPHAGATWFFKLDGPDAVVAREKSAFLSFLQSLRPVD
jgi:hypothetical protein